MRAYTQQIRAHVNSNMKAQAAQLSARTTATTCRRAKEAALLEQQLRLRRRLPLLVRRKMLL
jgi:hypothetical protein